MIHANNTNQMDMLAHHDTPSPCPTNHASTNTALTTDLVTSARRWRDLLRAIDQGFCIFKMLYDDTGTAVDYRFLEVNPTFERHTGLKDAVGKTARELVPELDAMWLQTYARVAETGERQRFEQWSNTLGRWFEVEAVPVGELCHREVALLFTDITARKTDNDERKRNEQALHRANQQLALALDRLDGFLYEYDLKSGYIERSAGIAGVLGYDLHDIPPTSQWWDMQIHPDDRERTVRIWRDVRDGDAAGYSVEYRIRHCDGHYIFVWDRALIERDEQGHAVRVLGTTINITERKQAEVERLDLLERMQAALKVTEAALDKAEAATRERDLLISIAAHDLRSPLTIILGQAQLFQRRAIRIGLEERDQRTAMLIAKQAARLNQMIGALLDLSRIQEGHLTIEPQSLDLTALLERVSDEVRITVTMHAIELHTPATPLMIHADALRLEQVFHNLLGNAVKYSPNGGTITVSLTTDSSRVYVRISDQGIGIPSLALPHLFTRFYRAPNATMQPTSSLGVGLFVVRELVQAHGGSVTVESVEGQGSTFIVELPVVAGA